nr:hypothetical protein OG409_14770 [Streptomyces sp. NBC_00974]
MHATGHEENVNLSEILDVEHYADLVEYGGLAAAITCVSRRNGMDLGRIYPQATSGKGLYKTAHADSSRGRMSVLLGLGRRSFSLKLEGRGFVWASGSTSDLSALTAAMDAWRRGEKLRDLSRDFPFLEYGRISQGHEDGIPVETQWNIVLESERLRPYRDLLLSVRADARLRELFPTFSHDTLRLAVDCYDREAGEIVIQVLPDGSHSVLASADEVSDTLAELAGAAASAVSVERD